MININIATLFPDMCESVLTSSMIGRARKSGLINICTYNIRDFTDDKHNRVDDTPYGGGRGMLMQADPIYKCFEYVSKTHSEPMHVIYLSPKGKTLTQHKALELSKFKRPLFLICGHYEGIDQRVIDEIVGMWANYTDEFEVYGLPALAGFDYEVEGDGPVSGIVDAAVVETEAPAVYYNLQGVQVANPENGLYIVRRGNQVTKELIRK